MKPKRSRRKTRASRFAGKELIEITQIIGRLLARDWLEEQGIVPTTEKKTKNRKTSDHTD
jgi:hypothetical protein